MRYLPLQRILLRNKKTKDYEYTCMFYLIYMIYGMNKLIILYIFLQNDEEIIAGMKYAFSHLKVGDCTVKPV